MASGTISRDGETPVYAEYCTSYCIVDDVCTPKMTRADYPKPLQDCALRIRLPGPQDIKIPSWQRKLVWSKDQVEKLVNSESSMFGTVIMAKGVTDEDTWTLIDGLQRFSVGTALLNALYNEVLAPTPNRLADSAHFTILAKAMQNLQPVFQWNHDRLNNLGKRGVKNSYIELFQTIQTYVIEKLDEDPAKFGESVVSMFLIKQLAVDPYSGFSKHSDLIKTFLSINSTGEVLTKIDLLRAKILEHLESKQVTAAILDEIENDFTDTFQNRKGKYFHDLGINIYNIMFELPDTSQLGTAQSGTVIQGSSPEYVFPNWKDMDKENFDDFFEYHQKVVNLGTETISGTKWKWPYLAEIFPFKLPYIMLTMYYFKNHYLKFLSKRDEHIEKRKFEIKAASDGITLHELQIRHTSGSEINFTASKIKAKQEILEIINEHAKIKELQNDLSDAIGNQEPQTVIEEIEGKIEVIEDNEQAYPNLFDELPDFLDGNLNTEEDLKKFYRAVMRKVLDGNIGKTEKILHATIRGTLDTMEKIAIELNPDLAGEINNEPNHNWLKSVILRSKKKSANPKIIFNACLLPDRSQKAGRDQFNPMIYKNGTNFYNIDHLIADSQQNKGARGLLELQSMVNLAPLEWTNNVLASSTPCSQKLSSSLIYGTIKDKHPYCKWLVNTHFPKHSNDDLVFPISGETTTNTQEDPATKINPIDSQVNLLEGRTNSISNERVEYLIEVLTPKL